MFVRSGAKAELDVAAVDGGCGDLDPKGFCTFGSYRFSYLLDPKGFCIFWGSHLKGFLILILDPKGFRIFWIQRKNGGKP